MKTVEKEKRTAYLRWVDTCLTHTGELIEGEERQRCKKKKKKSLKIMGKTFPKVMKDSKPQVQGV